MKSLNSEIIENIKKLRLEGQSIEKIATALKISSSTCHSYCKDIAIPKRTEESKSLALFKAGLSSKKRSLEERKIWFDKGLSEHLSVLDSLFVGCYWGEGSKYSKTFVFTNSDPEMIKLCFLWLKSQNIDRIRLSIQCHPEDDEDEIKNFWKNYLQYSGEVLIYKIRSKSSKEKVVLKRKTVYGTARVSCFGATKMFELLDGKKHKILKEFNIGV